MLEHLCLLASGRFPTPRPRSPPPSPCLPAQESDDADAEEEEEKPKPAAKKQKANDGSAVDVSAANGSRTIFIKNLAWATDDVSVLRRLPRCCVEGRLPACRPAGRVSGSASSPELPRTAHPSDLESPPPPPALLPPPPQDALHSFFAECGKVAEVRIAYDRETGRARGFAHIQFEELEGAAKAVGLSGANLLDREVYIESTEERAARECGCRGRGGRAGAALEA